MKPIFLLITLRHLLTRQTKEISKICLLALILLLQVYSHLPAQNPSLAAHSILPVDGVIQYLPKDTTAATTPAILSTNKLRRIMLKRRVWRLRGISRIFWLIMLIIRAKQISMLICKKLWLRQVKILGDVCMC